MENKVIFIILTAILVVTLIFNSILVSKRVSKTAAYWWYYDVIVKYEAGFKGKKINNRGVFKDLHNFEKDLYLSSLIILLFSLIIAILLLLAEFVAGLKRAFQGMVFKILNIVNIIFCGVYAIISLVLFIIFCCINDTDRVIRKHYIDNVWYGPIAPKGVKNRSISHIILNLILFIILAVAAILSFLAMKNGSGSSGSSSSSGGRKDTSSNKNETNKQMKENEPIKTNKDNAGASERPINLLTKDAPK
jgi:hypothetical protein